MTHTGTTGGGPWREGTISGAYGTATAPTADGPVEVSTSSTYLTGTLTQTGDTWSFTWSWDQSGGGNANHQTITVSQSDGAGNTTTVTHTIGG